MKHVEKERKRNEQRNILCDTVNIDVHVVYPDEERAREREEKS